MFLPWFKSIYIKAANEKNTEAHTVISANLVTQREIYYNAMGSRSVCIRENIYSDSDIFNVWICPSLQLRFPELSILCSSGSNRNLYFDADERVFLIKSRYNKSYKFDSRILFLDVRMICSYCMMLEIFLCMYNILSCV